jgi:pilus assembly protein CpaC
MFNQREAAGWMAGVVWVSGLLACWPAPSVGQPTTAPSVRQSAGGDVQLIDNGLDPDGAVDLQVNKSRVLSTTRPYKRISVGQSDVADVNGLGADRILVTAKKPGSTQLIVWDDQERAQAVDVRVSPDMQGLKGTIARLFPGSKVDVALNDQTVILSGRVPNVQAADQAQALASGYGQKVVNLLEVSGGQQVLLQVRFAEVSRSAASSLGVNLGFVDASGAFGASNVGQINPFTLTNQNGTGLSGIADTPPTPSVTTFGRGNVGSTTIEAFINALRQNNLLRVLAEPNLMATSGQEASFLAGGEYPIPVTQGGGAGAGNGVAITIEYREFGVRLGFVPVVLGDGRIRLKVSPEVSDLDYTTAVRFNGFVIPGLNTRRVSTTVELLEGQTFAVAGLLNNSVSASKDVTPLLGDVPVLGALFRSVRYQRKETELVVLVTPRLVGAMNPGEVPALPGEQWRDPSEVDLFLDQDLGGPKGRDTINPPPLATPRPLIGRSGYEPQE